jgi:hypothetical protein
MRYHNDPDGIAGPTITNERDIRRLIELAIALSHLNESKPAIPPRPT